MGIQVRWDDSGRSPEKTVIVWTFKQTWNWHQFHAADQKAYTMALARPHFVHTIVDFAQTHHFPRNNAVQHFTHAIKNAPVNQGFVLIVGANGDMLAMENILRALNPRECHKHKYLVVDTMDEAYHTLAELNARPSSPASA